jgi:hypothetical protein
VTSRDAVDIESMERSTLTHWRELEVEAGDQTGVKCGLELRGLRERTYIVGIRSL